MCACRSTDVIEKRFAGWQTTDYRVSWERCGLGRRSASCRTDGYQRTALSVVDNPSSMMARPSSSCASVMTSGGFVQDVVDTNNRVRALLQKERRRRHLL